MILPCETSYELVGTSNSRAYERATSISRLLRAQVYSVHGKETLASGARAISDEASGRSDWQSDEFLDCRSLRVFIASWLHNDVIKVIQNLKVTTFYPTRTIKRSIVFTRYLAYFAMRLCFYFFIFFFLNSDTRCTGNLIYYLLFYLYANLTRFYLYLIKFFVRENIKFRTAQKSEFK